MLKEFYRTLFDPNQSTCFSDTPKGTRVEKVKPRTDRQYFTINALDPAIDRDPIESYHRPDRPRRADHNVVCFRNILIEMDLGSFEEQEAQIMSTGLPWSTYVTSGNKSLHFIISLVDPVADRMSYGRLVRQVYQALGAKIKIDSANKNPSRFSRCPGAFRKETGMLQKLIAVQGRVPNARLEAWLEANQVPTSVGGGQLLFLPRPSRLFDSTLRFLEAGATAGEWNVSLFRAACNLFSTGVDIADATARFRAITGTLDSSDLATINSAYRRVVREKVSDL